MSAMFKHGVIETQLLTSHRASFKTIFYSYFPLLNIMSIRSNDMHMVYLIDSFKILSVLINRTNLYVLVKSSITRYVSYNCAFHTHVLCEVTNNHR